MKWSSVHVLVWSVLGVALTGAVELPKLPDNHVTCYRDDPEFNRCFKTTLQNLCRAFITRGIPAYELHVFDPAVIPNMVVNYNQYALRSHLNLTNVTYIGFDTAQIRSVRSYFNTRSSFRMDVDTTVRHLIMKGDYDAKAHFLYQPINEKGFFNMSMRGVDGTWRLYGKPLVRDDGETYVKLDFIDYRPRLRTTKFYASHLYSANKDLNDAVLAAINAFWPVFYEATLRDFSRSWGEKLTEYLNHLFLSVPHDTMFPLRNNIGDNSVKLYEFGTQVDEENVLV